MPWFKEPTGPDAGRRHFERRAKMQVAAGVHTVLALLLAFKLSGCDTAQQKTVLFFWIMFGPMVLQMALVIGARYLPYSVTRLELGRNLAFGVLLAFPFWLVGLAVMNVVQ